MTFGLFGALTLEFGTGAFGEFSLGGRCGNVFDVTVVAQINDCHDRYRNQESIEAGRTNADHDGPSGPGAGEISDRYPEKVLAPHVPDLLIVLQRVGYGNQTGVRKALHQPHKTNGDD